MIGKVFRLEKDGHSFLYTLQDASKTVRTHCMSHCVKMFHGEDQRTLSSVCLGIIIAPFGIRKGLQRWTANMHVGNQGVSLNYILYIHKHTPLVYHQFNMFYFDNVKCQQGSLLWDREAICDPREKSS